jgi:hypothetical protein
MDGFDQDEAGEAHHMINLCGNITPRFSAVWIIGLRPDPHLVDASDLLVPDRIGEWPCANSICNTPLASVPGAFATFSQR